VRKWNEWLQFPINISSLPLSAQLAITVWDISPTNEDGFQGHAIPYGGTTIALFDKDDTLQKGRQRCRLYRHRAADGFSQTKTPAELATNPRIKAGAISAAPQTDVERELERLESVFKKHEMGEIPRVDWLDRLVFEQVGRMEQEVSNMQKIQQSKGAGYANGNKIEAKEMTKEQQTVGGNSATQDSERFSLIVEFPRFDFPVVFTDHEYTPTPISSQALQPSTSNVNLKPPPEVQFGPGIRGPNDGGIAEDENAPPLIRIYDPEAGAKDNPAENKHRRLVRSHRTGVLDRDLRPNAKIRDELNTIMAYGPTQELNGEEKDLIWKFRHHLTREKRALTKFVKSVAWQDQSEVRQAIQLLPKWTEIDVDDALELLGPTFDHSSVRAYAVERLRKADDEELRSYLLQLVQALKYEKVDGEASQDSSLANFLISRATRNFMLGNYLYWYLMVECDDKSVNQARDHRRLFEKVAYDFMAKLMQVEGGPEQRKQLLRQAELFTMLSKLASDVGKIGSGYRPRMIEHARKFLADPKNGLLTFDPPLPLPLDPNIMITGVYPEETNVFKSSLHPMLIHFKCTGGRKYSIIFKDGDDLRQDQLVIQIISLMDRLLRKENLDLKLTPYHILAMSTTAGAAQFVPSIALQVAKNKYGGNYILDYLKANNPDKKAEYGVRPEAMDNYIKSCAGYCVVTYLLGVGDRHLDNLLLSPDGRLCLSKTWHY
jgi:phosphatidylinositol 3-kinase